MATLLSFDERHRVILITFEGIVTDELLLSRFRQVKQWLKSNGQCSNISDFTNVSSFQVTAKAISQLAAGEPLVSNDYLRVVVAPQDNIFGFARMFEMRGSETRDRVHIFRSIEEAYQFTGIEMPEFCPITDL